MKRFMSVFLVLGVVLAATHAVAAAQAYPKTQAALEQEFMNMPWEAKPGSYTLNTSNSQIDLPPGFAVLRGDPARRFMFLTQGAEKNETEAVIANPDNGTQLILSYHETGYIESGDWNELDTDALLTTIMDKTEADNANRAEHQLPRLTINGWLQEPMFHAGDNSVSWALDITEGDTRIANAIVLRLGRKGFERLTWVGTYQQYKTAGHSIDTFRNGHNFQDGLRYADFSAGDKLAGFGIASLVAVMAGGSDKTRTGIKALLAGALVFFKKLWVPIVVGLAAVAAYLRRFFGGGSEPQPATPAGSRSRGPQRNDPRAPRR